MHDDKIDGFIRVLSELAAFLVEIKHRSVYGGEEPNVKEVVEKYFNGFNYSPENGETFRRDGIIDALQLNKQNFQLWTAKELRELPFLKDLKYRKTSNGIHQFRYRRDGMERSFGSKNYEVAKKKARAFIKSLKRKLGAEIKVKHVDSLSSVAKKWFEMKRSRIDATTLNAYLNVYKNHIEKPLGGRNIARILPMDIQPLFDELYEKGLGKTSENVRTILKGTFDFAVANRLCPNSPMKGVIVEKHSRKAGRALNQNEIDAFKKAVGPVKDYGILYLIILYTGIRGCEVEKMTFDWENGTCTVFNGKLKRYQKRNPENLTRTFPIFAALYPLRERIESEAWRMPARKISNDLSKFWSGSTVKDLRHTFCTKAREARIENELVNLWTGHLPGENMTANVYTHFSMDYQKEEAKKLLPY